MEKKEIVPIMSGDVKYVGLTMPEWISNLVLFFIYYVVMKETLGVSKWYIICIFHFAAIIIYGVLVSKLEENIIYVIKNNIKIPSIIFGRLSRPIPIEKSRTEVLGVKSSDN